MPRPVELPCTPNAVMALMPCLRCLSRKELIAVLVFVLAEITDYDLPTDTDKLLEDSACWTCLSNKERLEAFTAQATNAIMEEVPGIDVLRTQIKCLVCATENQLQAALSYLLCLSYRQGPGRPQ